MKYDKIFLPKTITHDIPSSDSKAKGNPIFFPLSDKLERKEIHPAIQYFNHIKTLPPSIKLKKFLSSFNKPRSIDPETFAEGVKKFIRLANRNPLYDSKKNGRKALYGDSYLGLHYSSDLAKLWNDSHAYQTINASQIATLASSGWDSVVQDGFCTLIYKGQKPAAALDKLVKGPTVIDCGMFTQLSLWFGIRYMLGNKRFNQYFGRAPFFITQNVYNPVVHSHHPYSGNPLYSFLATKEQAVTPSVTVKHIANTALYPLKHPGGDYGGENCIVMDKEYYIFDPLLIDNQALSESAVLNLLHQEFNKERTQDEIDRLSLYALNPEKLHPLLPQTFGQLLEAAESLRDRQLTKEEFHLVQQNPLLEFTFDLHKFSTWLQTFKKNMKVDPIEYLPRTIDHSLISNDLLKAIPFENRTSMDFSQFKQETSQQKEFIIMSKQFCQNIIAGESKLVILSGKAGIGKTASAVCAAKELAARGKKSPGSPKSW